MVPEYRANEDVIWVVPTNAREMEAIILRERPPQAPVRQADPHDLGPQAYPGLGELERQFEIKVKMTGKTLTVPESQLRKRD